MDAYRNPGRFTDLGSIGLARGMLARLADARGVQLQVESGSVWITQDGSTDDVCLDAGQSCRIERDGLTLIAACGSASFALVTLDPPMPIVPAPRGRLWKFWAGPYVMPSRPALMGL